jgi:hypothetical protein
LYNYIYCTGVELKKKYRYNQYLVLRPKHYDHWT